MAGKVRILKERLFKVKKDDTKLLYVEGACDNDATPPQGNFVTGSAFENVTSGNKYKYSETSGDWVLQPSEGGTGGGVLVVSFDPQTGALDKTWKEIHDASFAVVHASESPYETTIVLIHSILKNADTGECTVQGASSSVESATVTWYNVLFIAESENDYPVMQE